MKKIAIFSMILGVIFMVSCESKSEVKSEANSEPEATPKVDTVELPDSADKKIDTVKMY